jgi:hypothetical protein
MFRAVLITVCIAVSLGPLFAKTDHTIIDATTTDACVSG